MVQNEKYVRRRKALTISIATMLTLSWCNVFFAKQYEPDPQAHAANESTSSSTTDMATSETAITSTSTTTTRLSTTTTTTSTTSTTTSSTTTSQSTSTTAPLTTTAVVVEEPPSEDIYIEEYVEEYVEEEPSACVEIDYDAEYEFGDYPDGYVFSYGIEKGSADYILLCNCLGLEYGSDTVDMYEKAKVVEVILNRVSIGSPSYRDTIYGVISQPYQFSGCSEYLYLDTYSRRVTYSVKAAVDWYLEIGWQTSNHGYVSFWGDGTWNHFS